MPYADPAKKREWDETHRPDRKFERLRKLHEERNFARVELLAREAYNETEDGQRKLAAYDSETSYDLSLPANKTRLKLR
jgi:hypothetical protein